MRCWLWPGASAPVGSAPVSSVVLGCDSLLPLHLLAGPRPHCCIQRDSRQRAVSFFEALWIRFLYHPLPGVKLPFVLSSACLKAEEVCCAVQ